MATGVMIAGIPVMAEACTNNGRYGDFAAQVNGNLDWLLCLHNEQVDSLNRHADLIDDLGRDLQHNAEMDRVVVMAVAEQSAMLRENAALRESLVALDARVAALEAQLAAQ